MTQKQYDDMATILKFCRIFADQMRICMKNTGLWDKGFLLTMDCFRTDCSDGCVLDGAVRMFRRYDEESHHSEDMEQLSQEGKGWYVVHDPVAKTGSLPPDVKIEKCAKNVCKGSRKDATKPYPPDGMWISSYDDTPDVVVW